MNAESIASFLPTKSTTDRLMDRYWYACHPICRIIYRPTFEQRYSLMWAQISMNEEPSPSFVALTLGALLSATISLPEETVMKEYNIPQNQLVDRVKSSTETVLFKANFLRTSKLETLQAFVLYLVRMQLIGGIARKYVNCYVDFTMPRRSISSAFCSDRKCYTTC